MNTPDKKKILLVEDDLYIRDIYKEVLKNEGYDLTIAIDGQDGLTKAREGGYDLILLDMMMPKMDGMTVLKELQKNPPKEPNTQIVVLTNLAHDAVIQEALALGAKGYLVKSGLNPDEFVEQIRKFIA